MKILNQIILNVNYLVSKYYSFLNIPFFTIKFIIFMSKMLFKISNHFLEFSWHIVTVLNLSFKIKREFDFLYDIVYIQLQILNKKKYNLFWNVYIKEKNYFSKIIKIIQMSENYILKKLKFRMPMKFEKQPLVKFSHYIKLKKVKKLKSLYYKLLKKKYLILNIKNFFFTSLSTSNMIWYEIWYSLKSLKKEKFPWWRYFNVRESDLEYYDQFISFNFSITGLDI